MHLTKMQFLPKSLFICTLLTVSFGIVRAGVYCKPGKYGSKVAYTIFVGHSNSQFRTVQSAIDSIPAYNDQWIKIHISPGTYTEQVMIDRNKPCIILEGNDPHLTKITYYAHQRTDLSATFSSFADNFIAKGITFENSYNRAQELREQLDLGATRAGKPILQAVAARVYGDKSAFYGCGFLGMQDTLWDVQGRHFFFRCYIEGAVDFIFGNGQSIYEDCTINSTAGLIFPGGGTGYITAQGRESAKETSGFIFRGGQVTGIGQAYLGRAYGPYSRVIFFDTWFSSVVTPPGWNAWSFRGKEGNFMYGEIGCKGPGSDTSKRVWWANKLNLKKLNQFSTSFFINRDGWLSNLPR